MTARVEMGWASQTRPAKKARTECTPVGDPRPFAFVQLAPEDDYFIADGSRHDIFVLGGELVIAGDCSLEAGTYCSFGTGQSLKAGRRGARFLHYQDQGATDQRAIVVRPLEREWGQGAIAGLRISVLRNSGHRVSLVSWLPGTRIRPHNHPTGEEIFVLKGVLKDERGDTPKGGWLRLHPGATHAPYAEKPTMILLRNGHLSQTACGGR